MIDTEEQIADAIDAAERITAPGAHGGVEFNKRLSWHLRNDVGNAQRLIERFGDELIYVRDAGWYVWTGTHWDGVDGERQAQLLAHRTAMAILGEAEVLEQHLITKYGVQDNGELRKEHKDQVSSHRKWVSTSGNSGRIAAMLLEARPYLARTIEDFDADPYLFNVLNGTLELRGEVSLRPHNRKDYISRVAPVRYRPEAAYNAFRSFLHQIMPADGDQLFLQQYFGYCMTGDVSEQKLLLCHGTGSNGKSTLTEIVAHIMGDYAMTLPFASLLHDDRRSGAQASPDIARLPGARLVTAAEPEVGARFSESLLKSMTGGDTMTARHLNQGFFEFRPQFKLLLLFNNKPSVRGQDEGIWRRLMMLPFARFFQESEKDRKLQQKLHDEADGILNWLLDGLRLWLERGLTIPDSVRDATENYRSESDPIGQFLDVATTRINGTSETAKALYDAFCRWCTENAMTPIKMTSFGRKLSDRGIERQKSSTVSYKDIMLHNDYRAQGRAARVEGDEDKGERHDF